MHDIEQQIDLAINCLLDSGEMDYIGESVSQLEHALQSAYYAEQAGHSDEVILASLFHDIGHFASHTQQHTMAHLGIVNHEWIGAKLIYDMGFSAKVALLIGYHVDAKRYLAGKKPNYYERLSDASKGTLAFQGGPMNEDEMLRFEQHPFFRKILQVRINDEKGKELNVIIPGLNYYRPRIKKHLLLNQAIHQDHLTLVDFIDQQWVELFKQHLERQAISVRVD